MHEIRQFKAILNSTDHDEAPQLLIETAGDTVNPEEDRKTEVWFILARKKASDSPTVYKMFKQNITK